MLVNEVDEGYLVYVRQSWLNDAMLCPERSRLSIVKPEWRTGTDATILGTAVHTGIEKLLNYEIDRSQISEAAQTHLRELIDEGNFKWTNITDENHLFIYADAMCQAFVRDLLPEVDRGGHVEHTFTLGIGTFGEFNGKPVNIFINGTMDYVTPGGVIWDWKTAARKYSQSEKQRQSIQASMYALASHKSGFVDEWPVRFNYGVMTRAANSVGQIVPVVRTEAHARWLQSQIVNVVHASLRAGIDTPWLANDQNNLCSERWCQFWSICKGAHLSEHDNKLEVNNG